MEELDKWKLINSTKTINELKDAITKIGNIQISNGEIWTSMFMNSQIFRVLHGDVSSCVTRNYGIRQHLLYLMKDL